MTKSSTIKAVAWVMVISLSQVLVFANRLGTLNKNNHGEAVATTSAEMPLGRLVADGPVTINGVKARTGDTVFPGAQIQTVPGTGVTIQIGKLGQLDVAPATKLVLTYDRESIHSDINIGCAVLATNDGVRGLITMPGGITRKNDLLKGHALSACSDGDASAAAVAGAKAVKVGGVSSGAITLGAGNVSFAEFGSMMLGSTAMMTGLNSAVGSSAAANGSCCCCCCCCNPSKSAPCL